MSLKLTKQFINNVDNYLFDCDGVLWRGKNKFSGVESVIKSLKKLGKKCLFVTNNSVSSRKQLQEKLKNNGIEAELDECYSTSYATALFIKSLNLDGKVFLLGNKGLKEEFELLSIDYITYESTETLDHIPHSDLIIDIDENVRAVVVGMDRSINYLKIAHAQRYLVNKNTRYIATNYDATFPISDGKFLPGTGTIVSAISIASSRLPEVIGKPSKLFFEVIQEKFGGSIDPSKTVMIGDRLDTDIEFGINCNLKTILVLSGVTQLTDLANSTTKPDIILKSLIEFNEIL